MRRNSVTTYLAGAIVVIVISFIFTLKVLVPRYKENKTLVSQLDGEIAVARSKLDSLQRVKSSFDELGDQTKRLFVSVPDDVDHPNLLTELEALALANQSYIPSIQIAGGNSGSTVAATPPGGAPAPIKSSSNIINISFTVDGNYESLSKFITALENDIRFMNIKTLSLTSDSETGMSLTLEIEAYRREDMSLSSNTAAK